MFKKITKKDKRTNLEKEIDSVIRTMGKLKPSDDMYTTTTDNLEKLYDMKSKDSRKVSPDTKAVVAGSIIGTLLVLYFEKTGAVTTKALAWILRGRV